MSVQHWLQLALTDGIGPILSRRLIAAAAEGRSAPMRRPLPDVARYDLLAQAGGIEAACNASESLLSRIQGVGRVNAGRIHASLRRAADAAARELDRARALGIGIICPEDEAYPPLLHEIPDPPLVLYVRGTIEARDLNAVGIVGSRRCSYYGREQAERFGALLAGAGFTITSGGARGIDSAAHRGALAQAHGRTIAVLGCGLDVVYPPENKALFDQIAGHGAILSEYPLGTQPLAENFPRRNRIVSGMSRGVLVVEADLKSGALITARQAVEDHNRPVMALPGRVDNPLSAGPHLLIREGAALVTSVEDIIEALGPISQTVREPMPGTAEPHGVLATLSPGARGSQPSSPDAQSPPARSPRTAPAPEADEAPVGLSEAQRLVLMKMETDTAHIDLLIERTGLEAHEVLRELTFLTLKGLVRRVDGQTFVRTGGRA